MAGLFFVEVTYLNVIDLKPTALNLRPAPGFLPSAGVPTALPPIYIICSPYRLQICV
jgi:hypothetical protein